MIYTYSKAHENPDSLIHFSLINIEDPLFIFCHLNNGYYGCDFKFHKCVNVMENLYNQKTWHNFEM